MKWIRTGTGQGLAAGLTAIVVLSVGSPPTPPESPARTSRKIETIQPPACAISAPEPPEKPKPNWLWEKAGTLDLRDRRRRSYSGEWDEVLENQESWDGLAEELAEIIRGTSGFFRFPEFEDRWEGTEPLVLEWAFRSIHSILFDFGWDKPAERRFTRVVFFALLDYLRATISRVTPSRDCAAAFATVGAEPGVYPDVAELILDEKDNLNLVALLRYYPDKQNFWLEDAYWTALQTSAESTVQEMCASRLGENLWKSEYRDQLIAFYWTFSPYLRSEIVRNLKEAAWDDRVAYDFCRLVIDQDPSASIRGQAIRALGGFEDSGDAVLLAFARGGLVSDCPHTRAACAVFLGEQGFRDDLPALEIMSEFDRDYSARSAAQGAVWRIKRRVR